MSGHADSIRERRARESWENGGWEETTSLAYEVVRRFSDSREQLAVLEKVLLGRLDREYLSWNGRTH